MNFKSDISHLELSSSNSIVFKVIKLTLIIILSHIQICQLEAQCHPDDWTSLKALYESTDGDNWTNNSGWSQVTGSAPPANCNLGGMHRVVLDGNGRVSKLLLYSNGLDGVIPPEIGGLSQLIDLTLQSNQISGNIPTEIGDLANLTKLNLYSNQLSGTIPVELGNLANLTNLTLSINQLSGSIPTEIGGLNNLTKLNISFNQLTGNIPSELGNLSSLTNLHLGSNQLTGTIPIEIGDLVNLTNLSLYTNGLTGNIPPEIGNLSSIDLLWLYGNQLTGLIPSELGDLSTLTKLRLSNNLLVGDIPSVIGNLNNLTELYLYSNQLTGHIPPEFGDLNNLLDLRIYSNQLSGCYDSNLSSLCTQLNEIKNSYISNANNFDADWEDFCANGLGECVLTCEQIDYRTLRALYLATDGDNWNSQTDGNPEWPSESLFMSYPLSPPPGFEDLDSWHGIQLNAATGCLKKITLSTNNLIGSLPVELKDLIHLEELTLSNNQMSGQIPSWIGDLQNLTNLGFNINNFTGPIPPELGNLSNLKHLWLGSNDFAAGNVPSALMNLSNLRTLHLRDVQMTGNIPLWVTSLTQLNYLSFPGNQMTGEIPPELGDLINLSYLNLGDNQFSGSLPGELGNLTNLTFLEVINNQLTGCYHNNLNSWCGTFNNTKISNGNNFDAAWEDYCANGDGGCTQSQMDYLALRRLYLCSDGDNWTSQTDGDAEWPTTADFEANPTSPPAGFENMEFWYGVGLNGAGTVDDLKLIDNNISGDILSKLVDLQDLVYIELNGNNLTGQIPPEIGTLSNLTRLNLFDNQLTGNIPVEISNIVNLCEIDLHNNQLTGTIPVELGNLSNLKYLILQTNLFTGSIPTELGNLSKLQLLGLKQNQLTGSIPVELGNLLDLEILSLSENQLTGTIPTELGNLALLIHIDFNDNLLTGGIPVSLSDLEKLEAFLVCNNNLSGAYSTSHWNWCRDLTETCISDGNNFDSTWDEYCAVGIRSPPDPPPGSEETPACIMNDYIALRALYLSTKGESWDDNTGWPSRTQLEDNKTTPPDNFEDVSLWFGVTTNDDGCVTQIILPDNDLDGQIPEEIGLFEYITRLNLRDNKLIGELPPEIADLVTRAWLYLDKNKLTGSIPLVYGDMVNIRNMHINDNDLEGCYDLRLGNLCNYLSSVSSTNDHISDGNDFEEDWEDFCTDGSGTCGESNALIPAFRRTNWTRSGLSTDPSSGYCHPSTKIDVTTKGADKTGIAFSDTAVEDAIDDAGSDGAIIYFPEGEYRFSRPIKMDDNIVLKGDGAGLTHLIANFNGSRESFIEAHGNDNGNQVASLLAQDALQNQTFIEVSPGEGQMFSEGECLKLEFDDGLLLHNPGWATVGQIVVVRSIVGDRINLISPLRRFYRVSENTKIIKYNMMENVGVECLKITREDETPYGDDNFPRAANISYRFVNNGWVHGVESYDCNYAHIKLYASTFCKVSGSFIKGAHHHGDKGRAYGVVAEFGSSDNKIEDNAFESLRHSMLLQSGANGNVIGYNFSRYNHRDEIVMGGYASDLTCHGNYVYMNLFEGNYHMYGSVDASHGANGPYNTYFRNRANSKYGFRITKIVLNALRQHGRNHKQNVIGYEIPYFSGRRNYVTRGDYHFERANRVKRLFNTRTFAPGTDLPESAISLYFGPSSIPPFLAGFDLPIYGLPNDMVTEDVPFIPAIERVLDLNIPKTAACLDDCPCVLNLDKADGIVAEGFYYGRRIISNATLESNVNITFRANEFDLNGSFYSPLSTTLTLDRSGCIEP